MNKTLLIIVTLFAIACNKDDESVKLTVTVQPIESLDVTISWNLEGGDGQTLYRIVFNDETIEDGFNGTQYTFTGIENYTNYSGVVFAISENGDDTFANFNFTTKGDIWYGDRSISRPYEVENFNLKVVTGRLQIWGVDDLSSFSSLEQVGALEIRNSEASSLQGLHNISTFTSTTGAVKIKDCPNLTDVSALSNVASQMISVDINDAPSLSDLTGLGLQNNGNLILVDCNVSSLQVFGNLTQLKRLRLIGLENLSSLAPFNLSGDMLVLILDDLPSLTNLNDLNSIESFEYFELNDLDITSLQGLDSWSAVNYLRIFRCDQLENLDGTSLNTGFDVDSRKPRLSIWNNPNLTDLCGFRTLALNVDFGNFYQVSANAYNPNEAQLESETGCRQ